jgi:hypothetical protein
MYWFGMLHAPGDKDKPTITVRVERDSASLFVAEGKSTENVHVITQDDNPLIAVHTAYMYTLNCTKEE